MVMKATHNHDKFDRPRRWLGRPKITLGASDRSVVLSRGACGVSVVSDEDIAMMIRRRGQNDYLLEYPLFDTDDNNRLRFILDSKIHELPDGRYEAMIVQGCTTCGAFEIELDKDCDVDVNSVKTVEGKTFKIINGEADVATDIFNDINTLELQLCAILEADATTLPLSQSDKDTLCALVLCCAVELVVTDGVKSEIIAFEGCDSGNVTIRRGVAGTDVQRFPAGSDVCFTWTTNNILAAQEGCP